MLAKPSFVLLLCITCASAATSSLWGSDGSLWSHERISEYAYVGYEYGEVALPFDAPSRTATGMTGDGSGDNTAALQDHIDATPEGGVLLIPAGTYRIDSPVFIRKPIVLRGEGQDATVIAPSRSLFDVYGMGTCIAGENKGYGWCRGFLEVDGTASSPTVTTITAAADRGDRTVAVESVAGIAIGDEIAVQVRDPDTGTATLYTYMLGGLTPNDDRRKTTYVVTRVQDVDVDLNTVTLERSLPFDVRLEWRPTIELMQFSVHHTGIEDLTVEMPSSPAYPGHHKGAGYNAIELSYCRHCFVRNVTVLNADLAINLRFTDHSTIIDVVLDGTRGGASGIYGHHGVDMTRSSDCLVLGVRFNAPFVHDITVDGCYGGNVITGCYGAAFSADHHGNAPVFNLIDDIVTQSLDRVFISGGATDALPHSGMGEVFWNVRNTEGWYLQEQPHFADPYLDLVITPWAGEEPADDPSYILESLIGELQPGSLYEAQYRLRLGASAPMLSTFAAVRAAVTGVFSPGAGTLGMPCRPAPPPEGDVLCKMGILSGQACCHGNCTRCGGSGCASLPGGPSNCCTGTITAANVSCWNNMPPCLVPDTIPPPPCEHGMTCEDGVCVGPEGPETTTAAGTTTGTTTGTAGTTTGTTGTAGTTTGTTTGTAGTTTGTAETTTGTAETSETTSTNGGATEGNASTSSAATTGTSEARVSGGHAIAPGLVSLGVHLMVTLSFLLTFPLRTN